MVKTLSTQSGQAPDQIEVVVVAIARPPEVRQTSHSAVCILANTTKVKTASAVYSINNGGPVLKATTDNLFTLAGTVTNAKFNVYVLTLNASGTANAYMGTEAATLAAVVFP